MIYLEIIKKTRLLGRFKPIFCSNCEYVLFFIHCKTKTNKKIRGFYKKQFGGISKFSKNRILLEANFWKFDHNINLPWGNAMDHKKIRTDSFNRFDICWIQAYRHPNKHLATQAKYIGYNIFFIKEPLAHIYLSYIAGQTAGPNWLTFF